MNVQATRGQDRSIGDFMAGGAKHIFNASIRIPALLTTATAVTFVGEAALRGVNLAKAAVFQLPYSDILASSDPNSWAYMLRPLGRIAVESGSYLLSNRDVVVAAAITTGASIILSDVARVLCGSPPAIYNKVLSFIGPVRLSDETVLLGRLGLLSTNKKTN